MVPKQDSEEIVVKFWKNWIRSDSLKRIKLIASLPICKAAYLAGTQEKSQILPALLNDLFEDLYRIATSKEKQGMEVQ